MVCSPHVCSPDVWPMYMSKLMTLPRQTAHRCLTSSVRLSNGHTYRKVSAAGTVLPARIEWYTNIHEVYTPDAQLFRLRQIGFSWAVEIFTSLVYSVQSQTLVINITQSCSSFNHLVNSSSALLYVQRVYVATFQSSSDASDFSWTFVNTWCRSIGQAD